MTMADMTCDVCGNPEPIGVASTIMPYSCAFCKTCAEKGAQPLIVFECIYDDVGTDFNSLVQGIADQLVTYHFGRYITYKEWATLKKERADVEGK